MNTGAVMDGLAAALDAIGGLKVYEYPPDAIVTPAGIVGYPDPFSFDAVMGRGADRGTFPVHVVVSKSSDRAARSALVEYMAGFGAKSVKAALEVDGTLGGVAASVRVTGFSGVDLDVGGVRYVAASFSVDVIG